MSCYYKHQENKKSTAYMHIFHFSGHNIFRVSFVYLFILLVVYTNLKKISLIWQQQTLLWGENLAKYREMRSIADDWQDFPLTVLALLQGKVCIKIANAPMNYDMVFNHEILVLKHSCQIVSSIGDTESAFNCFFLSHKRYNIIHYILAIRRW